MNKRINNSINLTTEKKEKERKRSDAPPPPCPPPPTPRQPMTSVESAPIVQSIVINQYRSEVAVLFDCIKGVL